MKDLWSAPNIIAMLTALLGLGASFAAVWIERRPRHRLIGYRVQMAIRVGGGNRRGRGRSQAIYGLFNDLPSMSDATLVLLRIENYGAQSIAASDYTDRGPYGLTADLDDLQVRGVVVIPDPEHDHLLSHFDDPDSVQFRDNVIKLPRVPLNPGQHYKLLLLLAGDGDGSAMRVRGGIRDGAIMETESVSVDDRPRMFSRRARQITAVLTVCLVVLTCLVLIPERSRRPLGCATGKVTVVGSTAFEPVIRTVAQRYEQQCPGATITMAARGSEAGLREVAASDAENVIAISDGRVGQGASSALWGQAVALSTYALAVNNQVAVQNLTRAQIGRIFAGQVRDWSEINPRARGPVQVMSRTTDSGSRIAFDGMFLGPASEPAIGTAGCIRDTSANPEFCLLASTAEVVDKVAAFPGAIGYASLRTVRSTPNLHSVAIDGHQPEIHDRDYRFTDIEYAYTHKRPVPGSLTDAFLAYLITGPGRSNLIGDDDQPCYTPDNLPRCTG